MNRPVLIQVRGGVIFNSILKFNRFIKTIPSSTPTTSCRHRHVRYRCRRHRHRHRHHRRRRRHRCRRRHRRRRCRRIAEIAVA